MIDPLLGTKKAADYLGISKGTLDVWRSTGRYQLPFIKIGRIIKYRQSTLDTFIEQRTMTHTK